MDAQKKTSGRPTMTEQNKLDNTFNEILNEMKKHGLPDIPLLRKAYFFAGQKHEGQRRSTGEPYMMHPLEVARILAKLGHESDMVAAALLHDVVEDCDVSLSVLENEFSTSIADIVNAVTKVNRLLEADPEISKTDLQELSDEKFLTEIFKNCNRKAVYIKCADRIHNLRTIGDFPEEKQRAKANHTRNVIIPAAKKLHIHKLVDILGTLCLAIENPWAYKEVKAAYRELINKNQDTLFHSNGVIETVKNLIDDEDKWGRYVKACEFSERCVDSLFTDVSLRMENGNNIRAEFTKRNVPLYDVYFIVRDSYTETPETLFFKFYNKMHNTKFRFTITGVDYAFDEDGLYYKLEDRFGIRYRLFIQSESEHLEFTHGILVSDEMEDFRKGVICEDGKVTGNLESRKIVVFKKDGSPMMIEEGATVLDFAFAIDRNIGICAKCAYINNSKVETPLNKILRAGDIVTIDSDHDRNNPAKDIPHATVRWFEYLHTQKATKFLSRWLEKHMDSATPVMIVYDGEGKQYEIEMASTVLDFAFVVGEQVGLHVKNAYINKCQTPTELDKVLRYGDRVKFDFDPNDEATPVFTWLSIVKTKLAKECLIAYFDTKYNH